MMNDKSLPLNQKGRRADKPAEMPRTGWKDISLRVRDQLKSNHVHIIAAGIAFYFFLAIFPAITATLSIYGLVMEPAQVTQQMSRMASVLPDQAHQMISDVLHTSSTKPGETLGWSLLISLLLGLWSANKGTKAVFAGVNVAYNEVDQRNFILKNSLTLMFTLGGVVFGFISLSLVAGFSAFIDNWGFPPLLNTVFSLIRWAILAIMLTVVLSITYKVAPVRNNPEFKWVTWGAIIAMLLWLTGSYLFSFYVDNFGRFDNTYGSFAAIIILMLWLFLTGYSVILGAVINAEMEHQTSKDTTVGEDKPMGQRNAYYADHVASDYRSSR
jgi:membrane protein